MTTMLNNGCPMPVIGLGTWQIEPLEVGEVVGYALLIAGYRHIDGASAYGNEPEIGHIYDQIFREHKLKREEVFITSKLANTHHHPDRVALACRQTLTDLNLDYLDLYLMHWGIALDPYDGHENGIVKIEPVSIKETWEAMESLVDQGLVKAIGVSNFTVGMLVDLTAYARIQPAVNQVEIHPYLPQLELVDYCHQKKIVVTAYSPLGSSNTRADRPLTSSIINDIAHLHHRTPAQVLLRWCIERGLIVIPKSIHSERIAENINLFDFELTESDHEQINQLNRNQRFVDPINWLGIPYFK